MRGGNVSRYTISDGEDERRERIYTGDSLSNSLGDLSAGATLTPVRGEERSGGATLYRRNSKGMEVRTKKGNMS